MTKYKVLISLKWSKWNKFLIKTSTNRLNSKGSFNPWLDAWHIDKLIEVMLLDGRVQVDFSSQHVFMFFSSLTVQMCVHVSTSLCMWSSSWNIFWYSWGILDSQTPLQYFCKICLSRPWTISTLARFTGFCWAEECNTQTNVTLKWIEYIKNRDYKTKLINISWRQYSAAVMRYFVGHPRSYLHPGLFLRQKANLWILKSKYNQQLYSTDTGLQRHHR